MVVSLRVGKIALFDKALISAVAGGALAMCAMRVGNECRVICLSVSFFIPSLIFHCQFAVSLSFFRLCITRLYKPLLYPYLTCNSERYENICVPYLILRSAL